MRTDRVTGTSLTFVIGLLVCATQTALAASGDRDTSFGGGDGMATITAPSASSNNGHSVAMSGNKIVLAGDANLTTTDIAIARFDSSGNPDTGFSGDGIVTRDIGGRYDSVDNGLAVLSDGSVLVAGYSRGSSSTDYRIVLAKYDSNGNPSSTFGGGDGVVDSAFGFAGAIAYDLVVQPDGKFVIAGAVYPSVDQGDILLMRFKANGKVDKTFGGGDGKVVVDLGPGFDEAWRIARTSDGKLLVGGWYQTDVNGEYDMVFAQFTANGAVDNTFGLEGSVMYDTGDGDDYVLGMAVSGNKIYGCNGSSDAVNIIRLKPNGARDRSFGGDGEVDVDYGAPVTCRDITIDANGRPIVVGRIGSEMFVAAMTAAGAKDGSFGTNGYATAAAAGNADSVVLQSNGRIVIGGTTATQMAVARFLP